MSKPTAASFFIESPSLGNSSELYQVLLHGIDSYHQLGNRLIQLAEHAHAFRHFDRVREYGQALSRVPIKAYQTIGIYFLAVAVNCNGKGDQDEARRLFELAIDTAPDTYKVKATLSLGALSYNKRDFDSSFYFYRKGLKSKKLSAAGLHAIRALSVLKAIEGSHTQAIKDLESILPVIKYAPAHIYFDILNSYAVELGEVGRKEEAKNIMRVVLASPFVFAYPEWRETAADLKAVNRSSVVIGAVPDTPHNVLFMPVEHERRQSSAVWSPAHVLDFQKWKAKMRKGKEGPSKQGHKIVTEKDMLVRLMEIFTNDETTDEQRHKIWEAAEKILTEPQPTGPENPA